MRHPDPRSRPLWNGEVLFASRLLIHSPASTSDLLALVRFCPAIKDLGGHVILECPRSLERLLARAPGVDELAPADDLPRDIDLQCPLAHLRDLFKPHRPSRRTPTAYLAPDPALVAAWDAHFDRAPAPAAPAAPARRRRSPFQLDDPDDPPNPLRIGVVWRSEHPAPFDVFARELIASLIRTPGTIFYSLQRGDAGGIVAPPAGLDLLDHTEDLHDFADLAAMLAHLHMVIGLAAPPAHLAAALGLPVWLLLPRTSHWCFPPGRRHTPWYPSARLWRA